MSGGGLLGKGPSTLGSAAKLTLGPVKNITKKAPTAPTAPAAPMPKNALNLLKSKMAQGLSVPSVYGKNLGYSRRSSPPKEAPPISPRVTAEPGAPSVSASPPPNDPSRASPPQVKRGITFRNNKPINNKNTRGKVNLAQINSNNNLQLARQNPNYTRNTVRKARSEYAILKDTFGDKWINAQVAINSNPKISANFKKYMNVRESELASLKKNYSPLPIPINIYKTYAIPDKLYRNINEAAAVASNN